MKTVGSQQSAARGKKNLKSLIFHAALFTIHVLLVFAFVSLAFGAEEAAHGGLWKEYRWQVLNFAVLVAILVYFAKSPFKAFLRQRTELIEKAIREAQEAKQTAERALAEVEERLKLKDREIEGILDQARSSAKTEQDLLIESGTRMTEKIIAQAKNNIDYEVRLAKEAIKAEAGEVALELAEKKLKERLTKEEQTRLIEESLARMEGRK